MNKDMLTRAGWTFVQTLLAVVVAAGTDYVNVATWRAAVVAAGAAALSSLKTAVVQRNNG